VVVEGGFDAVYLVTGGVVAVEAVRWAGIRCAGDGGGRGGERQGEKDGPQAIAGATYAGSTYRSGMDARCGGALARRCSGTHDPASHGNSCAFRE
jgi:hypothetical protein